MKRTLKIAAIACFMVLVGSTVNKVSAQYNDDYNNNNYYDDDNNYNNDRDVSYQTFYDELSPHGQWIDYPGQGYVWVPDADQSFQPYSTNGHWVWTDDYEWMWVSDYDWGWAPFHYGRWDNDPYYGWYWVPGYEWSPAWVAWRDGGDYYGWAPIRPGIHLSNNFNIGSYSPPNNFWCFAPRRYIASPYINRYYVDRGRNVTIINQTNIIINNYRYGGNYGFRSGPRRVEFERYTGRINPVRFRQSNLPGRSNFRGNEVSFYRPNVNQNNSNNRTVAPRQFERYERREGSFRNDRTNNATVRNNNNGLPNSNLNDRGNNLPDRRAIDRTNEGPNNRTDRNNRQITRHPERNNPSSSPDNNNPTDRRFDRRSERGNVPDDRTPTQPNNRSVENDRQPQRTMPSTQPRQSQQSPFTQQRQPSQQMENRQEPRSMPQQQQQPRQFERRENSGRQPDRQMERQPLQEQQPRQQMERSQVSQQVESRPAQQPRQVESRPTQHPSQFQRSTGNDSPATESRNTSERETKKRDF
ncbi:MAG: DUF6600 domain-containing protein [Chitinophagaceae bacterium]